MWLDLRLLLSMVFRSLTFLFFLEVVSSRVNSTMQKTIPAKIPAKHSLN